MVIASSSRRSIASPLSRLGLSRSVPFGVHSPYTAVTPSTDVQHTCVMRDARSVGPSTHVVQQTREEHEAGV